MSQKAFYPGLEGLRGVSVLAVLVFHAETTWLQGGFLGVSTFFTLSGFLITGLLVREWEQTRAIRLSNFWARRLRRLLPASLLALLAIAVVGAQYGDPTQKARLTGDGLSALFYFSNWWLIVTGADYDSLMGSPSAIQHFWSLSIEEQYYFVYPVFAYVLLRATRGSRKAFTLVLATTSVFCWVWMAWLASTEVTTARLYYGTDTRAAELLAGGVLAMVLWSRPALEAGRARSMVLFLGLVGLAITVRGWTVATVESSALYEGGFALYTLGSLAVIAAAIQSGGPVRVLLSWSVLRWLGRISYGAYVYHWPIFLFVEDNAIRLGLTLLCADLSYRLLEEPIRQRKMILGWHRFVVPPAAIGIVVLAFVFSGPEPSATPAVAETATTAGSQPSPLNRKVRIAVFGDSLAGDIAEGLEQWARKSGKADVENMAVRGCGIARGAWSNQTIERRRAQCDKWPERVNPVLKRFVPDVIVLLSVWDLADRKLPEWEAAREIGDPVFDRWLIAHYAGVVDSLREAGAKNVVWLTIPCFDPAQEAGAQRPDTALLRKMNEGVLWKLDNARDDHVSIIDLAGKVCPDGQFTNALFGIEPFRPDGVHFSDAGKLWVATWLGETLINSLAQTDGSPVKKR